MRNASGQKPLTLASEPDDPVATIAYCGTLATASCAARADGGLWFHTTPEAMARTARDLFGGDAAEAIAWCALSAQRARRDADLRFWRAVSARLEVPGRDGEP